MVGKPIADAGKTPKDNALQKTVKTAMKVIKGTIADLPATEDLVKVVIKVAPNRRRLFRNARAVVQC